ncbi:MAG: biotin--[acetyl-CoA-carboxylase] ligase [Lachnospiraceae bacterium]|uniref:Biotin--[acetyl-CoA-carboxylase] ligase n=1 Tax=Candidatus Weimeria bifida TaxID=2599074 RepID=A0A6N7J0C5_9FIRM|nr:biotin--[acetyl-CoA-carboxylase] ligase [Candidatus Weimeria bifida]RRF96827.1 MAG: biotin--[acetyl-CoA-carboxylase] ligase [Lachnospiraceae bacterium]
MIEPIFKYFEEIDSTNLEAKREGEAGAPEFTVISAGTQTAGRGRSGHTWISPEKISVATSMLIYPKEIPMEHLPRLTIVAGVAVAEAVEELYPLHTQIKWPNDVLIDSRKICGILTEMEAENGHAKQVVCGIGVNVHQKKEDFAPEIRDMATSLDLELAKQKGVSEVTGKRQTITRNSDLRSNSFNFENETQQTSESVEDSEIQRASRKAITEAIWQHFLKHYEIFKANGGSLEGILDSYNSRLANKNKRVRVVHQVHDFEGIALEMDPNGRLLIKKDDGTITAVDSGEVHVRGLYGYA